MSDVLKNLRTHLVASTSVTSKTSNRWYYGNLPQNPTLPAGVLHLIDSETQQHHNGRGGIARSSVQVDCHADNHDEAYSVAEAVRLAAGRYNGLWGTLQIRESYVLGKRDLNEPPPPGSQLYRHVRSLDLAVWHAEAST